MSYLKLHYTAKLNKYRILFIDILTVLEKFHLYMTFRLSGNDYRVATLS